MRVAMTGTSGLIGSALEPRLRADGHEVVRLVRRPAPAGDEVQWDPAARVLGAAVLEGVDAVVPGRGEHRGALDRIETPPDP